MSTLNALIRRLYETHERGQALTTGNDTLAGDAAKAIESIRDELSMALDIIQALRDSKRQAETTSSDAINSLRAELAAEREKVLELESLWADEQKMHKMHD